MTERYVTERGSTVEISGKHRGIVIIDFDWFEEGACCEAKRNVSAEVGNPRDLWLLWYCECCGGGSARLRAHQAMERDE